jgi:starvation-inducible outer membrane lipoprotein
MRVFTCIFLCSIALSLQGCATNPSSTKLSNASIEDMNEQMHDPILTTDSYMFRSPGGGGGHGGR